MANALSSMGGPPPAPNPQPQDPSGGGAPGASSAPQQQQQAPAPSHQQTVAALRHFSAIEDELRGLLADPDLGKADMKSKIIDGATKLVANGIMTAAQAVTGLGSVPERPFEQKQWVASHYATAVQAANAVLDHHRAAFAGTPAPAQPSGPDDHQAVMSGLLSHYQGLGNAR